MSFAFEKTVSVLTRVCATQLAIIREKSDVALKRRKNASLRITEIITRVFSVTQ